MKIDCTSPVTLAAPLSAEAEPFIPEFADLWADSAPTVRVPASAASFCAAAREAEPAWPARVLVPRRSGSRTPRRDDEQPGQRLAPSAGANFVTGDIVAITKLSTRPDLVGAKVVLAEYDATADRWLCLTREKERLRIKPEKLQGLEVDVQMLARQEFMAV